MDREKVKKGLYQHCEGSMFDRCGECPYYEFADEPFQCRDALLMDAHILLKEQKPKQIVRKQRKRENSDDSIDYFAEWYCPHCGKLLKRGFDAPWIEYCYKCGKKVKWE